MPATGWDSRFDRVTGTLQSAARSSADRRDRHRRRARFVVGALGPVERVRRAAHRGVRVLDGGPGARGHRRARAGAHLPGDAPSYIWLWGNLLAALAIARAAPEGRFQQFARGYRTMSFVVLGHRAAAIPVVAGALRAVSAARAPACDASYGIMANACGLAVRRAGASSARAMRCRRGLPSADAAAAPAAAAAAPTDARHDGIAAEDIGKFPDSNVSESLQRVPSVSSKARAQLRAGRAAIRRRHGAAGRPRHSRAGATTPIDYCWSGPVEVRRHRALHLRRARSCCSSGGCIGVVALAALFAWLALLSYGKQVAAARVPEGAPAAALPRR